jgi:phospholipid/cholesterol/gamma-HCH transport system substrate-binding protein
MKGRVRGIGLVGAVLVAAVLSGAGAAAGVTGGTAPRSLDVVAEFTDAGAVIRGNDVRVDGVQAGRVTKVEVRGGLARLTLRVDGAFAPLHTDASVAIRPVSLLGERFVDLDRGTPSAPVLGSGGVIPPSRTRRSVDLQEVLDAVDQPTGTALAALLVGLGEGMAGRGADAAAGAQALEPAFTRTAALLELLGDQNKLLGAVVDRSAPVLSALASGRGERLDRLVGATDDLLGATATASPALDEGLRRLPAALASARSALAELAGLAGETTPVLASLRPVTGDLRQMADELGGFADGAGPALAALDPVLDRGRELIDAARPVVAELNAAGGDFERVARSGRSLAEAFPEDLSTLLDFIRNVALATSGSDGVSHYLRVFSLSSQEALDGQVPKGAPGPPALPTAPAGPSGPVAGPSAGSTMPDVVKPTHGEPDPGSATGLTAGQERALLQYLLGGR